MGTALLMALKNEGGISTSWSQSLVEILLNPVFSTFVVYSPGSMSCVNLYLNYFWLLFCHFPFVSADNEEIPWSQLKRHLNPHSAFCILMPFSELQSKCEGLKMSNRMKNAYFSLVKGIISKHNNRKEFFDITVQLFTFFVMQIRKQNDWTI